ncbi:MAG TPA: ArsC family reductase [Sphingobacteriaceae bacterium]|nr:ArsC family reductase [Sphingobacteriaceae bacterium]
MKIYGIKNCDTVKKALTWYKDQQVAYDFHDFKKSGISEDKLKEWANQVGWEALINKRGTTWKKLDPALQNTITTEDAAFKLMQDKTSVIKRPVSETKSGKIVLGFNEDQLSEFIHQ